MPTILERLTALFSRDMYCPPQSACHQYDRESFHTGPDAYRHPEG